MVNKKAESTPSIPSQRDWAKLMGVRPGQLIQELGWDTDSDSSISEALESFLGEPLLDDESDEVADSALLWWRSDDGDLVDGLVDATRNLNDGANIWVLTPVGDVSPGEIAEAAKLAGMVQTSSTRLNDWQGACLVTPNLKKN